MALLKKDDTLFLKIVIILSCFLIGGYHVAVACFLSVLLLFYMVYNSFKEGEKPKIQLGLTVGATSLLAFSYLIVCIWAVDSGSAVYGFFKLLPVALLALIVSAYEKEKRMSVLECIPVVAAVNGVLAYALSFIPGLAGYFLVAERLGGFFQSPNAFAVFCLAGIIILLTSEKIDFKKWALTAVLTVLIFLTGSRTVFVFFVVTVLIFVVTLKNKKAKRNIILLLVGAVAVSIIVVIVTDSFQTMGRYLTISLESSTFLGRLLYYKDAIPVILRHPFGLGYYGYYFTQGSFQTGVYSVAFVHNSFLQLLLDVGFVPAIAFIVALAASLFSKGTNLRQKLLLLIVFGHSLFDFDLEFTAVFFVLVLAMDFESGKKREFSLNKIAIASASGVLMLLSVYFAFVNIMYLSGEYNAVEKIYGFDTMTKIQLLTQERDPAMLNEYADEIIKNNGNIAIAYDVKANEAYSNGDFEMVMKYKDKALECSPYTIEEYIDYCDKLIMGISLYESAGDDYSAAACKKALLSVRERAQETKAKTSSLGLKIYDKPDLDFPQEYEEFFEACEVDEIKK